MNDELTGANQVLSRNLAAAELASAERRFANQHGRLMGFCATGGLAPPEQCLNPKHRSARTSRAVARKGTFVPGFWLANNAPAGQARRWRVAAIKEYLTTDTDGKNDREEEAP